MFGQCKQVLSKLSQLYLCWQETNERTRRIETKIHRLAAHHGADLTEDRLYAKRGSEGTGR